MLANFINNASTSLFSILDSGKVGIGTTTPQASLSVIGSLCVASTTSGCNGTYEEGTIYANNIDIQTAVDLAENYQVFENSLEQGDIVSVSKDNVSDNQNNLESFGIVKASNTNKNIIGIISTKPGMTLGGGILNSKPVALSGRVPVKVNLENGPIEVGDRISLSSTSGIGMKMSGVSAQSIGIALESYDGSSSDGKIIVLVNLSWNKLDDSIINGEIATSTGPIWITDSNTGAIKSATSQMLDMQGQNITNIGSLISNSGSWSMSDEGVIRAKTLCLEDVCIDGNKLHDLLLNIGINTTIKNSSPSANIASVSSGISTGTEESFDTEIPVIVLNGNNPATIELFSSYLDPGAVVADNKDHNLGYTASVWKDGAKLFDDINNNSLDTRTATTYIIKYNAKDGAGNQAIEVERTVIVKSSKPLIVSEPATDTGTTTEE